MEREKRRKIEQWMEAIDSEEDVAEFLHRFQGEGPQEFHEYLTEVLRQKKIRISVLMKRSGINKNYGYNIINGTRKNPGRDKVLALCIGAGMSLAETQEALDIAGVGRLYYRCERDVWIAYCLSQQVGDVTRANLVLEENGQPALNV